MDLRSLSLCAGIGAHDIALRRWVRTVGYVERDAFAAACLVEGMAQEILDSAPIWDDLCTFDGRAWRGVVDLVSAGIPCQPYSVAGKRKGNDDERALWPELVRIVREVEPGFVFIENTPEFITHAEPVWRELRGLGFEWEEPLFVTASHVGAIHKRRRVFLLATHGDRARLALGQGERGNAREERATAERDRRGVADANGAAIRHESGRIGGPHGSGAAVVGDSRDGAPDTAGISERELHHEERSVARCNARAVVAGRDCEPSDSSSIGRREGRTESARLERRRDAPLDRRAPSHPDRTGFEGEWCGWVFDRERQTFRHDADRCSDRCRTRGTHWDSESPVCRVDARPPNGADSLHVLGNAVPPQQTEQAFRILFESACARIVT